MPRQTILHNLHSTNSRLMERSADLNALSFVGTIAGPGKYPLARYVDNGDLPNPPAPAWYLPDTGDIYIHVDDAKVGSPERILAADIHSTSLISNKQARILGLLAHEAAHAGISDRITVIEKLAPHHQSLLTALEELRVENHAVRTAPPVRRFLRASFGLILANLPDTFENNSHVVRAWMLARGRTLAGVAAPDETDAVDTAARTLLGDEIIDALTDLLQEALTLRLDSETSRAALLRICDEWVALVGEPAESTSCTGCARRARPGEKPDVIAEPSTGKGEGDDEEGDEGAGSGSGDGDEHYDGDDFESDYGTPGQDDPADDSDLAHLDDELLDDEDAELLKMLMREVAETMDDDWKKDTDMVQLSNAAEWGAKIFGNRRKSQRVIASQPTAKARQHVVEVATVLSSLALPSITKQARPQQAPPGRMRSREALRASAERAQGKMMTAKPWKATVRRHTSAKPLVVGVATDTSGSMKWAESGVAEFAYVYANAGHRIGARTAAVTFGDHVHRIARPGEVLNEVLTKTANDGTEEFDQAMAALDGVLHLTTPGTSARILIVVSDAQYVKSNEAERAYRWVQAMIKAGTHIVWITDRSQNIASGSYTHWVRKAMLLPGFTLVGAFDGATDRYTRSHVGVFDKLNEVALAAIRGAD